MFTTMYSNRFKALEIPEDPTDYEEFEDVAPYNILENRRWTFLWLNRHPNAYLIQRRFGVGGRYNGKLMWRELNLMKEEVEKLRNSMREYQTEVWARRTELYTLISEQRELCDEDTRASKVDTILLGSISAIITDNPQTLLSSFFHQVPSAMMMMQDIISFVPIETCAEKLQKHLDTCTDCSSNFVGYYCQFKENGRCSHYYEIQDFQEELEREEYYEDEDKNRLVELEIEYERALAIKEDRLQEYEDAISDDDDW